MGNRGMTNWKLGAFFVMSLMLIAAVFSNTAAANNGSGKVAVEWTTRSTGATGIPSTFTAATVPLNAGSLRNALEFTYTADTAATTPAAINMASGRVRITFPTGWTVSGNFIRVTDDAQSGGKSIVLYTTNVEGKLTTADGATVLVDTSQEYMDAMDAVDFTSSSITVNLGSGWNGARARTGRELRIVLSDVTAAVPSRLTVTDE